jgi:hypothetical protein
MWLFIKKTGILFIILLLFFIFPSFVFGSFCYAARDDQPCPDIEEIRKNQQELIDLRDLILYYKNRIRAEAEDLQGLITQVIEKKINFFEESLAIEKKIQESCKTKNCAKLYQNIINSIQKDILKLQKAKDFIEILVERLIILADVIEKINEPTTQLAALPDQCFFNIQQKCDASCFLFFTDCSGGNPCPTDEIQNQLDKINFVAKAIERIADKIIELTNVLL